MCRILYSTCLNSVMVVHLQNILNSSEQRITKRPAKEQSRLNVRKYSFSQKTINIQNILSTHCVYASQWRIQVFFLVARTPTPTMIFLSRRVTPLLAPTLNNHLHLRRSETPLETNSGYATASSVNMVKTIMYTYLVNVA